MMRYRPLCLLVPTWGFAHTVTNGPHGGEVEDAKPGPSLHIETVMKGTTVTVHLTDWDGRPLPVIGVSGSVIVLANERKVRFQLAPTGSTMLSGTGDFADDANMKVLVTLIVSGMRQQALFSQFKTQAR